MAGPHTPGLMPVLVEWLEAEGIEYEVHEHQPSFTATGTALVEGVDPHSFAKVVWVRSDEGGTPSWCSMRWTTSISRKPPRP